VTSCAHQILIQPTRSAPPVAPALQSPNAAIVSGSVVFGSDVWDLSPLCPRPTTRWIRLNFVRCPEPPDTKHFFYLLLT